MKLFEVSSILLFHDYKDLLCLAKLPSDVFCFGCFIARLTTAKMPDELLGNLTAFGAMILILPV